MSLPVVVRKIVSNAASSTCGEGFCLEVRSGGQNGGQSCGGCPTPPVVSVYGPRSCRLYQAGPMRTAPGRRLGMIYTEEDWN
jgi:hypothetical protein